MILGVIYTKNWENCMREKDEKAKTKLPFHWA